MDEKLFYEVNVTTSTDIKNAYGYAIANNIKFYRCIAKDGSIYGWDGAKYIRAKDGQEWFENPEYKEPEIAIDPYMCADERVLEDENKDANVGNELTQVLTVEDTPAHTNSNIPPTGIAMETEVEEETDETDYKALYEETFAELEEYKTEYNAVKEELDSIKNAFSVIAKEIKEATDTE